MKIDKKIIPVVLIFLTIFSIVLTKESSLISSIPWSNMGIGYVLFYACIATLIIWILLWFGWNILRGEFNVNNRKEFLKPTITKIGLLFLLFIISLGPTLVSGFNSLSEMGNTVYEVLQIMEIDILLTTMMYTLVWPSIIISSIVHYIGIESSISFTVMLFLNVIWLYFLSCLMIFVYNKTNKKMYVIIFLLFLIVTSIMLTLFIVSRFS